MKKFLLSVVAGMSLTATTMAQTVPSYLPTNGLVGYWGFDGNAQDYSGNGNHGTVNGATLTSDRNGIANKAYSFDGVNDSIATSYNGILGSSSRSITFWAKTLSQKESVIILYGSKNNPGERFNASFNYNSQGVSVITAWSAITYSTNTATNDNNWHLYAYVLDTKTTPTTQDFKIYQDGILLTSINHSFNPNISVNTTPDIPLIFGGVPSGNSQNLFFNGKLDEIGIWNRALTQQEITALYMECQYNPTITPIAVNLKVGNDVLFQVTSGGSNLNFQWQTNSNNLGWQNIPNNLNYSGANTVSLTVNNVQLGNHNQPFRVIATSGSCSDTSDVASIHVGDTCLITVHDTLVINRTITGLSAPNNKNTIKVYPNPAKDHVIIHYGNFAMMNGYSVKITNTLGQELFASPINQQTSSVNLSNWINHSLYFVQIIDPQGKTVETRKILIE